MNAFARCLVAVARQYVGPAAPDFLIREIKAIGVEPDLITTQHAAALGARVRATASQIMEPSQAEAFGRALALADATDQDGVDEAHSPDLGTRILAVARKSLGPAAQTFVTRELAMLGTTMDEVTPRHVLMLAERARSSAGVLMELGQATEFATALAAVANPAREAARAAEAKPRRERGALRTDPARDPRDRSKAMARALPDALLESSRLLRANLMPGQVSAAPPPLMVLGAVSDGGCARVAAGLAAVIAEEGRSTLLVDADLRSPSLHDLFGVSVSPGFAEALEAGVPILMPTPLAPSLSLLPAGRSARTASELLRLPRAMEIAGGLATRFSSVVYSGSGDPTHPDALLLAAHVVRAAVLVIRLGRDSADVVRRMKEPLEQAGVAILGYALLDNRSSLWVPKLSWTPWGKNGIETPRSFAPEARPLL